MLPVLLLLLLLSTSCAHAFSQRYGISQLHGVPRHLKNSESAVKGRSPSLLSITGRRCATASPDTAEALLLERQHAAAAAVKLHNTAAATEAAAGATTARQMRDAGRGHQQQQQYIVNIHAHIVSVVDSYGIGFGDVSDAAVQQQVTAMNAAYVTASRKARVKLLFDLAQITRFNTTPEADMCDIKSEKEIKAKLRTGDASTLNLYITDLNPCGVYGWSSWPWDIEQKGLGQDGVVVHFDTLTGGSTVNYNMGATAIHEIGHWLGLYHTFEHGCEAPGDSVADTPYCQAPISESCSSAPRDTCPDQPGRDPTDNYMSYSHDACLKSFTPGQLQRIGEMWQLYRSQK